MFTYLLIIVIFLFLIHIVFNYNYKARILRKVPGPSTTFIVGNGLDVNLPSDELFSLARKWAQDHNGLYSLYSFNFAVINIYNPEDIEVITSTLNHHEKSSFYDMLKPWLQEGLLLSNGLKWQQRRKILTTAFHFNVLKKYFVAIEDNGKQLIQYLKSTNGESIDLIPTISEYTLNAICDTAMGVKLTDEIAGVGRDYKKAIYGLGSTFAVRFSKLYYFIDFIYNLSPLKKKQDEYLKVIRSFTHNVIERRKIMIQNSQIEDDDTEEDYTYRKKPNAMLDLLIKAEKDGLIDKEGIQEEVDTFMFEGHDTTAAGLTYGLLALASEPAIQDKIYEEQMNIFEDDRDATMEDLASMKYLECCIKEILRLYPPVPFIARKISEDVKLSTCTIPAGSHCCIHIYDLHLREDLFKNAKKFDPDRFLPENSVGRHNYAYIPFSAGPRNCIGQKFAMMEMKSILSLIFRNFRLIPVTTPSEINFIADVVLRNKEPIYIKLVERSK